MAKVLVNESSLSGIADAIRAKNGTAATYKPSEMAAAIEAIETGGGGEGLPEEALTVTGDCQYRFAQNGWNWFIENYGNQITTKDITNADHMFFSLSLAEIPFELNIAKSFYNFAYMFFGAKNIKTMPKLNFPGAVTSHAKLDHAFESCHNLREVPEWLGDILEASYALGTANSNFSPWGSTFGSCFSLKEIPAKVIQYLRNPKQSGYYYGLAYSNPFVSCSCLGELKNLFPDDYALTSNQWGAWCNTLTRLKDFTFAVNEDGTPFVRQWKAQTLDMTRYVGYADMVSRIIDYGSGITTAKQVTDAATYAALKNDPDWFTKDIAYSRYNHDSAVNTINSLPDTSAYLATAGGTNTIKFKGASGSATDGGAINTLTEEEIAVAASKGWTVTLA